MIRAAAVMTTLLATVAGAQPVRNANERGRDRQDLRQDRRQVADDKRDAARTAAMLQDYDAARAAGDGARMAALDQQFNQFIAREIRESQVESAQARQEVREGKRELASDRRELGQDVAVGRRPAVVADDVHDRNRDRRDLADDRRDATVERLSRQRLQAIQAQLAGLAGRFDPASTGIKRGLYAEVVGTQVREVQRDKAEQREDRGELREDRRETREDRRDPLR